MAHDSNNFTTRCSSTRIDRVTLGNGTCMSISHIGSTTFHSPHTKIQLFLKNLLHVTHISKNLINVSKFAKDSHVYFAIGSNVLCQLVLSTCRDKPIRELKCQTCLCKV